MPTKSLIFVLEPHDWCFYNCSHQFLESVLRIFSFPEDTETPSKPSLLKDLDLHLTWTHQHPRWRISQLQLSVYAEGIQWLLEVVLNGRWWSHPSHSSSALNSLHVHTVRYQYIPTLKKKTKRTALQCTSSSSPLLTCTPAVLMHDLLKYQEELPTNCPLKWPLIAFLFWFYIALSEKDHSKTADSSASSHMFLQKKKTHTLFSVLLLSKWDDWIWALKTIFSMLLIRKSSMSPAAVNYAED